MDRFQPYLGPISAPQRGAVSGITCPSTGGGDWPYLPPAHFFFFRFCLTCGMISSKRYGDSLSRPTTPSTVPLLGRGASTTWLADNIPNKKLGSKPADHSSKSNTFYRSKTITRSMYIHRPIIKLRSPFQNTYRYDFFHQIPIVFPIGDTHRKTPRS